MKKSILFGVSGILLVGGFYLYRDTPIDTTSHSAEQQGQIQHSSASRAKEPGKPHVVAVPRHADINKQETVVENQNFHSLHDPMLDAIEITGDTQELEWTLQEKELARYARAELERDEKIQALKESGTGGEQWLDQLNTMKSDWLDLADNLGTTVEFSVWECYSAGCSTTLVYDKYMDVSALRSAIFTQASNNAWEGNVFMSGATERQAGIMESTWIYTQNTLRMEES